MNVGLIRGCTLGGNLEFFKDRKSVILGCLGGHFAGPGGIAPTLLKGLRGPRGPPYPQNHQFPTFKKLSRLPTGYLKAVWRDFSFATKRP